MVAITADALSYFKKSFEPPKSLFLISFTWKWKLNRPFDKWRKRHALHTDYKHERLQAGLVSKVLEKVKVKPIQQTAGRSRLLVSDSQLILSAGAGSLCVCGESSRAGEGSAGAFRVTAALGCTTPWRRPDGGSSVGWDSEAACGQEDEPRLLLPIAPFTLPQDALSQRRNFRIQNYHVVGWKKCTKTTL